MTSYSSSFTGNVSSQARVATRGANHELSIAEIGGKESCTDPLWSDVRMTYWSLTDLTAGNGTQRGYWLHEHADDTRDYGTFEGNVTTADGLVSIAGNFKTTGGSGRLAGISGDGRYKGTFSSPNEIRVTWEGQYQLPAGAATR